MRKIHLIGMKLLFFNSQNIVNVESSTEAVQGRMPKNKTIAADLIQVIRLVYSGISSCYRLLFNHLLV